MGAGTHSPTLCAAAGPTWHRRLYKCVAEAWGAQAGPRYPLLSSHPLAENVGAGERVPGSSPTPPYSLGKRGNLLVQLGGEPALQGGRASQAFGLRDTCQLVFSSLNPILRKLPSPGSRPRPSPADLLLPRCLVPAQASSFRNAQEPWQDSGSPPNHSCPREEEVGNLDLCPWNPATSCHLPMPHVYADFLVPRTHRCSASVQVFPRLHWVLAMNPGRRREIKAFTRSATECHEYPKEGS